MNIANSLGAALGGLVIAQGLGYLAPFWLGASLGVVGCVMAAAGFAADNRSARTAKAHSQETANAA
ncbi:hypothetical protein [Streptomyces cellulosae]|uniref:hypothetical protein n=1 Tax=Streptomyces cellulosae TaxID=1968 RepID=UPI0004C6B64A|nr:hypothetical protein [Streptomyces cellulosae]